MLAYVSEAALLVANTLHGINCRSNEGANNPDIHKKNAEARRLGVKAGKPRHKDQSKAGDIGNAKKAEREARHKKRSGHLSDEHNVKWPSTVLCENGTANGKVHIPSYDDDRNPNGKLANHEKAKDPSEEQNPVHYRVHDLAEPAHGLSASSNLAIEEVGDGRRRVAGERDVTIHAPAEQNKEYGREDESAERDDVGWREDLRRGIIRASHRLSRDTQRLMLCGVGVGDLLDSIFELVKPCGHFVPLVKAYLL